MKWRHRGKVMTNEELTTAINDAIYDFSDSLRGLIEEAARRLEEGQADEALRQSFRYAVRIVTHIQNEKPKKLWERYCQRCQQSHLAPIWYCRERQDDLEHAQEWLCGNRYGESSIHEKNRWILWEPPRDMTI
ncbi:MAG TPA: hypothetical protein VEI50_13730 [Nitrospiraceae bacterium]|nr:hypothetical protein [Nitrospiraceae bacterium]